MVETVQPSTSDGMVVITYCDTVAEFIVALSPRSDSYHSLFPRGWVFRGHADDDYELIPTALRNNSVGLRAFTLHEINNNTRQVCAKKRVLGDFLQTSGSINLHVPEDTQTLHTLIDIRADPPPAWPVGPAACRRCFGVGAGYAPVGATAKGCPSVPALASRRCPSTRYGRRGTTRCTGR